MSLPTSATQESLRRLNFLVDVLDPNRKIDNNYFSYTAASRDGKTFTGILANETAKSIIVSQIVSASVIR